MGAAVSQILRSRTPEEAKDIGNPLTPLYFSKNLTDAVLEGHQGYVRVAHSITKRDAEYFDTRGETVFCYDLDTTKFDIGKMVVVKYNYNWNKKDSLALENKIIQKDSYMDVEDFYQIIHPYVSPLQAHVTSVVFCTRKGGHRVTQITTRNLADIPYPLIPPLAFSSPLPHIFITDLVSPKGYLPDNCFISIVIYGGELYAFKHHEIYPEFLRSAILPVNDALLIELEQLSRISSPHILPATHIVTDRSNTGRFRGFLQPFCPAGSLKNVLSSLHKTPLASAWNLWGTTQKLKPFLISWPVKHQWCIQMTHALLDLHDHELYIGRLTPGSFLIDQDGNVKLVDISPKTEFNLCYGAPEEFKTQFEPDGQQKRLPTAEWDIFGLGLIFWNLAEELTSVERETRSAIPVITWDKRPGGSPPWFHDLVNNCIKQIPSERPSARIILAILTAYCA